ncbi:GNAT family N-acetyltransferase [Cystobacter fuscus]|uniref:GNAT family N-acetyltransferase n=1 Tax=Cystobacter fuscus TaxID=43 RepID=UPI0005BB36DD|nr:GNAT family N-acetyltransferase [Cystobacter fuscus]
MTDAELTARLRANLLAFKAMQTRTTALRGLEMPGVRALCLPGRGVPLFQQQVLYAHPEALAPALPRLEAWYRDQHVPAWRVLVTPGDSHAESALAAAGYAPEGGMPAMGLCLAPTPPSRLPPGLCLESSEDPREVIELNRLCYPPGVMDFLGVWGGGSPPDVPLYGVLVREAGRVLSGGLALDLDDTAGVYMVATHPEARRRGLGARVMEALHARALARGRAASVLQSSEEGVAMYQHIGYRHLGTWVNWVRRAGQAAPGAAPG